MTFVLCLLYIAVIYVRPGEIIPGWIGFPFVEITGVAAVVSAVGSLIVAPNRFPKLPNDWCFFGFLGAAILSLPANGWLGGSYRAFVGLQPLAVFYLLIRVAVQTERQLRWLVAMFVVLTLFQATNGIVQYHTGVGLGNSTAIVVMESGPSGDGDRQETKRIRGTGIFGDPNDLAMSLVIIIPFLFTALLPGGSGFVRRFMAVAALVIVAYALFLTQSRGGFMGFAAACAAYAYRRFGRVPSVVIGVVMVGLLAVGSSRMRELNSSEDSAQGRIQAWSAGLGMLKSRPILGVGFRSFTDYHERVAHNSFVHSFAELGLVGGYFFVGLFYWFVICNERGRNVAGAAESSLARDILASGVGVAVCAFFLSRQYSPVLYVPLVLGAIRVSVTSGTSPQPPFQRTSDWLLMLVLSGGFLLATYVGILMLAIWSGS